MYATGCKFCIEHVGVHSPAYPPKKNREALCSMYQYTTRVDVKNLDLQCHGPLYTKIPNRQKKKEEFPIACFQQLALTLLASHRCCEKLSPASLY